MSRLSPLLISLLAVLLVQPCLSLSVLIGNDDGFGTANIRALYNALKQAGHSPLIAAPVMQQSGTDGKLAEPKPLQKEGEFGLVPKGAPAEGHDEKDDHIWYINSTPASSIAYGLDVLAPRFFGGPPDIVMTGPNQGSNLGLAYLVSGTYGAAKYAVSAGVPAIALSAADATIRPYTDLGGDEDQANVYAKMSVQLLEQLEKAGKPLLPPHTGLNVNFPSASSRLCTPANSTWLMTRLLGNIERSPDACTCGQTDADSIAHSLEELLRKGCKLPTERTVLDRKNGCTNSVSVFEPRIWSPDAGKEAQALVIKRLEGLTSCPKA